MPEYRYERVASTRKESEFVLRNVDRSLCQQRVLQYHESAGARRDVPKTRRDFEVSPKP